MKLRYNPGDTTHDIAFPGMYVWVKDECKCEGRISEKCIIREATVKEIRKNHVDFLKRIFTLTKKGK